MQLNYFIKLSGEIKAITGLHIGGTNDLIEIGGMDNPVLKNPLTNEPYIPGSSLKGKMRMLLEWYLGKVSNGETCSCGSEECPICSIFGAPSNEKNNKIGPTRIIVRDSFLKDEWKKFIDEQSFLLTESKTENRINRLTAKATPRQIERVPAGAVFNFEMVYKVFDIDNSKRDEDFFQYVLKSMKLVEIDYLGGGGSRGNGQIKFEKITKYVSNKNSTENVELPDLN